MKCSCQRAQHDLNVGLGTWVTHAMFPKQRPEPSTKIVVGGLGGRRSSRGAPGLGTGNAIRQGGVAACRGPLQGLPKSCF